MKQSIHKDLLKIFVLYALALGLAYCQEVYPLPPRARTLNIRSFGAVGDGITLDTQAFEKAIKSINSTKMYANSTLYVPKGRYLIAPINLTSHFTLYLDAQAVILGTQDMSLWPIVAPLPSYGQGRDHEGGQRTSLLHGVGLVDVAIVGLNGTLDGQGQIWWDAHRDDSEQITRGCLIEFLNSSQILLQNITLLNSPFWNFHPWNSRQVRVNLLTVIAPSDSPNTDGIDPDSVDDMVIQNFFYTGGDDAIAIKSGWDCFGIDFNVPTQNLYIKNVTAHNAHGGITIGSEMSGGVKNVYAENCRLSEVKYGGIRIKSAMGRGGYVYNITFHKITISNTIKGPTIQIVENYGGNNPSCQGRNATALPTIEQIYIFYVQASGVSLPSAQFLGLPDAPIKNILLQNMLLSTPSSITSQVYSCDQVEGEYINILPKPCAQFKPFGSKKYKLTRKVEVQ